MHILAFLLLFVVGAILAACNGDYSGIAAIGKFVGGCVLLFLVAVVLKRNVQTVG